VVFGDAASPTSGSLPGALAFPARMINLGKSRELMLAPRIKEIRREAMTIAICWLDDLAKAEKTARETNRPILLDFYNPQ
jgi:hypothetical protein